MVVQSPSYPHQKHGAISVLFTPKAGVNKHFLLIIHGPWFICFVAIFSVYFYRCYLVRNRFAIKEGINANSVLNGDKKLFNITIIITPY